MKIRKSREEDFDRIMEIYAYARKFMAENGNPRQWGATGWPPADLIKNDIAVGKGYVCEDDGRIIGVFFYDYGENIEPVYADIEGKWLGEDTYGVVHRIATDGTTKGTGAFCINWAYEQCGHLRMDTHGDNIVMQNLLTKLGFVKCGITHVPEDDDPRIAYEKIEN